MFSHWKKWLPKKSQKSHSYTGSIWAQNAVTYCNVNPILSWNLFEIFVLFRLKNRNLVFILQILCVPFLTHIISKKYSRFNTFSFRLHHDGLNLQKVVNYSVFIINGIKSSFGNVYKYCPTIFGHLWPTYLPTLSYNFCFLGHLWTPPAYPKIQRNSRTYVPSDIKSIVKCPTYSRTVCKFDLLKSKKKNCVK